MEEIRHAFKLFDDERTGKISLLNLRHVAKEIGDRLEDDELYAFCLITHPVYSDCVHWQYVCRIYPLAIQVAKPVIYYDRTRLFE